MLDDPSHIGTVSCPSEVVGIGPLLGWPIDLFGCAEGEGVGGIEQKAIAARRRGATVFLVPACQEDPRADEQREAWYGCVNDLVQARKRAGSSMAVIPVTTIDDALAVLEARGGSKLPPKPAATTTTTAP